MTDRKHILSVYPIFFCYAFYLSMLGQLVPYLQTKHALAMSGAGMFSTLQSIGGIVAVVICIVYLDWVNKPKLLALVSVCFAALMPVLGVTPGIALISVLFLFVGLVNSLVNTLCNAAVSDMSLEKRSFYINLLHGFFGLGGAVGSQLTSMISGSSGMESAVVWFGVFIFICAAAYMTVMRQRMRMPLVIKREPAKDRLRTLKDVIKKPGMFYVVLTSFFNAFSLINILYWTYAFVSGMGGSAYLPSLALTIHFVFMTLSRFIGSRLTKRVSPRLFLLYGSMLGAVSYIAACFSSDAVFAVVMFGLLGLFTGNNFPAVVTAACSLSPDNTAAATGLTTLGYFLATIIAPPLIGWIGDALSLKVALIINALMLVPAGLFALKITTSQTCENIQN